MTEAERLADYQRAVEILTALPTRWQLHAQLEGNEVAWLREDGIWGLTASRETATEAALDATSGLGVAGATARPQIKGRRERGAKAGLAQYASTDTE